MRYEVSLYNVMYAMCTLSQCPGHQKHIYLEYHSVCPLCPNWDPSTPFSASMSLPNLPPPPEPKGGHTRLRVSGEGVQNRTTGENA